jgi:predicted nucleic acid-binding protein
MAWLVDTNVLSELRKGDRCHDGVRAWFDGVEDADLFTSVLVIGEIRRGIELLRRRDIASATTLDHWLARLTETYAERILAIDSRIAERWGTLNVPNPMPTVDGLLAATALEHGLTLVTRNTRHVASLGVPVIDPFADPW